MQLHRRTGWCKANNILRRKNVCHHNRHAYGKLMKALKQAKRDRNNNRTHRNAHQERTNKISDISEPSNENPHKRKIKAKNNKCSNHRLRQIRKQEHPPSLWRELAPHLRNQKLKIRKEQNRPYVISSLPIFQAYVCITMEISLMNQLIKRQHNRVSSGEDINHIVCYCLSFDQKWIIKREEANSPSKSHKIVTKYQFLVLFECRRTNHEVKTPKFEAKRTNHELKTNQALERMQISSKVPCAPRKDMEQLCHVRSYSAKDNKCSKAFHPHKLLSLIST
jgi:hypothetical protein